MTFRLLQYSGLYCRNCKLYNSVELWLHPQMQERNAEAGEQL